NVLCAKGAESPPDAGGAEETLLVIDNDGHVFADAQLADGIGKFGRRGEHVGQVCRVIGDVVDVEGAGAGQVARAIFFLRVATGIGHVPAGINEDEVGIG